MMIDEVIKVLNGIKRIYGENVEVPFFEYPHIEIVDGKAILYYGDD